MDLQDQRIACLRMAIEMGCKTDSVVSTAAELMNFITGGVAPTVPAVAPATEEANADRIAACGTEVPMTETADLALAVAIAAPSVASVEGMPESASVTHTVTELAAAVVEPGTPVSAAAAEEAAAPQELAWHRLPQPPGRHLPKERRLPRRHSSRLQLRRQRQCKRLPRQSSRLRLPRQLLWPLPSKQRLLLRR